MKNLKKSILLLFICFLTSKLCICESLNIDQKITLLFDLINQQKLSEDFFCFIYKNIFDVYFSLESMQSSQDIKNYFDSLVSEYFSNSSNYCGHTPNNDCSHKIYDRLRMLKRFFNNQDLDFLLFCKQQITNRSLTQSFDEGRIMEMYYNLVDAYENR